MCKAGFTSRLSVKNTDSWWETSDIPKLRDILQNNWPVCFKTEHVRKDKDWGIISNWRSIRRHDNKLKRRILNWILAKKRKTTTNPMTDKICIRSLNKLIGIYKCLFSDFSNFLRLHEILTLRKLGEEPKGTITYCC